MKFNIKISAFLFAIYAILFNFLFYNHLDIYNIILFNTVIFMGIFDFYRFLIPDTSIIIFLIISLLSFNSINILYALLFFLITYYYKKSDKIGFGDVKLLTVLSLFFGFKILFILILTFITIIIVNIRKEEAKIPFGYYIMFGITEYYFIFNFLNIQLPYIFGR